MTSQDPQSQLRRLLAIAGKSVIPAVALAFIGWGGWLAWPPLGPITVGALLWLDLSLGSRQSAQTHEGAQP